MNMVKLTKLVKKVQQGIEKLGIDIQSLTDFAENEVDETVSKSKISAAENAGETLKRRTRQAKETTEAEVEVEAPKQRRRRVNAAEPVVSTPRNKRSAFAESVL